VALEAADRLYQEVVSKDGVSVPDPRIGRHLYVNDAGVRVDMVTQQMNQRQVGNPVMNQYEKVIRKSAGVPVS
jgi:hypothetical protein